MTNIVFLLTHEYHQRSLGEYKRKEKFTIPENMGNVFDILFINTIEIYGN